jgi:hypothetical protein
LTGQEVTYSEGTPSVNQTGFGHSNRGAIGARNPSDDGALGELNQLWDALVFVEKNLV